MVARFWFSKCHHANSLSLLRVQEDKVKVKLGRRDDWEGEGLAREPDGLS